MLYIKKANKNFKKKRDGSKEFKFLREVKTSCLTGGNNLVNKIRSQGKQFLITQKLDFRTEAVHLKSLDFHY